METKYALVYAINVSVAPIRAISAIIHLYSNNIIHYRHTRRRFYVEIWSGIDDSGDDDGGDDVSNRRGGRRDCGDRLVCRTRHKAFLVHRDCRTLGRHPFDRVESTRGIARPRPDAPTLLTAFAPRRL